MSKGKGTAEEQLSNAKVLSGSVVFPILAVAFSAQGVNICTGILALLTLAFWFVLYTRISAMVRTINWPSRPSSNRAFTPLDDYTQLPPPPPTEPQDDSRSIFL